MAGIDSLKVRLEQLRMQAQTFADSEASLNDLFEVEADRLDRKEEAQRLREIPLAIAGELERLRRLETDAKYEYTKIHLFLSTADFISNAVLAVIKHDQQTPREYVRLFNTSSDKPPYGNVMVCIGPGGLPDDVRAISISGLARDSGRRELDVIAELRSRGSRLYSEELFSELIAKLADAVLEGKLRLPVTKDKLQALPTGSKWKPVLKSLE